MVTTVKIRDQVDHNSRKLTLKLHNPYPERRKTQGVSLYLAFPVDFIILDMPEDIKVPLILRRPFLSIARAKIDVYKRKITLRVREERIVFTSV
ncbi:hypothetical protein Tco_1205397, partial [Tanacetum coccineum]